MIMVGGSGRLQNAGPMIPVNKLFTSGIGEQWHKCADEARSVADDMKDEISKQMMLQIAEDYERLAKPAAHREPSSRGRIVKLAPELAPGVSVLPTCQPASIFVLGSLAVRQSRLSMAGSSASAAIENYRAGQG